jgi:hypothetical protein
MSINLLRTFCITICLLVVSACASTQSTAPAVTSDGLQRIADTTFDDVYQRPGVDLSDYTEFGVEDCRVSFKKNWLRQQNENRLDLSDRVTQRDVDRIKDRLGELCTEKFVGALLAEPAYNLVDAFADGEQVLVLTPSIINLDINAPDTMSAGRSRSYTTSAGEMTLSMDVSDATTGEVLYRIVDRRRARDTGRIEWTSSVSNKAEAERTLNRWADLLRQGLDSVRSR